MEWHSTLRSYFQPSLSSSLRQNPTLLYSGVAFHLGELLSHSSSSRQDPTPLYSKVASHLNQLLIVAPQGRMLLCYIVEWHPTLRSYFQIPHSSSIRQDATLLYSGVASHLEELLREFRYYHMHLPWQFHALQITKVDYHSAIQQSGSLPWEATKKKLSQQLPKVECYSAIQQSSILPWEATFHKTKFMKGTQFVESSSPRQDATLLYSGVGSYLKELLWESSFPRQTATPLYRRVAVYLGNLQSRKLPW